jgi:hypothetical protein
LFRSLSVLAALVLVWAIARLDPVPRFPIDHAISAIHDAFYKLA